MRCETYIGKKRGSTLIHVFEAHAPYDVAVVVVLVVRATAYPFACVVQQQQTIVSYTDHIDFIRFCARRVMNGIARPRPLPVAHSCTKFRFRMTRRNTLSAGIVVAPRFQKYPTAAASTIHHNQLAHPFA